VGLTDKGYIRLWDKEWYGKYEHRAVMERLIGGPIPEHLVVHHIDHDKTHNCQCNLMLLDRRIHDRLRKRSIEEVIRWLAMYEQSRVPDWVEGGDEVEADDELYYGTG